MKSHPPNSGNTQGRARRKHGGEQGHPEEAESHPEEASQEAERSFPLEALPLISSLPNLRNTASSSVGPFILSWSNSN